MKAKKAVKRLNKVETLLSDVIDQYSEINQNVRDLLVSARVSVTRAKETKLFQPSPDSVKKPLQKAKKPHITPEGKRKISLAAKKRWAVAKRKGVHG